MSSIQSSPVYHIQDYTAPLAAASAQLEELMLKLEETMNKVEQYVDIHHRLKALSKDAGRLRKMEPAAIALHSFLVDIYVQAATLRCQRHYHTLQIIQKEIVARKIAQNRPPQRTPNENRQ